MTIREGTPPNRETTGGLYEAYFAELWQRPWPAVPPGDDWLEGKLVCSPRTTAPRSAALVATT